ARGPSASRVARARADGGRALRSLSREIRAKLETQAGRLTPFSMETFRDAIDAHAAARPTAPCVLAPEPDAVLTYRDVAYAGHAIGAYLTGEGIAPGSVVSFMLPNGVAAASVFLGAMYAGYVISPVNLLAQDSQVGYMLAHSGTRLVFAAPEFIERL